MKVKSESEVAQSCPTLSDPTDCSPPGSSIYGILQARGLEWVWSHHFMANRWETMEIVTDFIFLGSKIPAEGDYSHGTEKDTCSLEEKL